MNAQEARQKSQANLDSRVSRQIAEVSRSIQTGIDKGQFHARHYTKNHERLEEAVISHFSNQGYNVQKDQMTGISLAGSNAYEITW